MLTDKEKYIALTQKASIKEKYKVDAVILLEGDGFARIDTAVEISLRTNSKLVFSGGIDDTSYGSFVLSKCMNEFLKYEISEEQIIHEKTSTNTREQALNIFEISLERKWNHIVLVASQYHQFRAFLTFLKVLIDNNYEKNLLISNFPAEANWFVSNSWGRRVDLLDIEFEKIEKYMSLGHLASYKEALYYYELWSI